MTSIKDWLAICIKKITYCIWRSISCNDRVLARIAALELLDTFRIPVFRESVVTIYLQLVSFVLVITLNHLSDVVDIQGIFNINSFYDDRGRIWLLQNFINVLI